MAAKSRDLIISKGGTRLLGIEAKSISAVKEGIQIDTDEDNGFRLFLADAGTKTLDISFSGVTKDTVIRDIILGSGSALLTDIEIQYPPIGTQTTGDTITGDFLLNGSTEDGGDKAGALTFSGTLQSSGEWTHTKGTTP